MYLLSMGCARRGGGVCFCSTWRRESQGALNHSLEPHHEWAEARWSQAPLMGIWKKGKTQQSGGVAGEIPTGCKEKKNPNESA